MVTCTDYRKQLALMAGGDLEPRARDRVRVHLDRCAVCSQLFARHLWAQRALRRAVPVDMLPGDLLRVGDGGGMAIGGRQFFDDLQGTVMARLAAEPDVAATTVRRRIHPAAAALLFCIGLAASQVLSDGPSGPSGPSGIEPNPVLTRPARDFPAANPIAWEGTDRTQPRTQPLGQYVRRAGYHGLAGRVRAAELVDLDDLAADSDLPGRR